MKIAFCMFIFEGYPIPVKNELKNENENYMAVCFFYHAGINRM
jgi:adenosine/AMP kinase